ncbi:hypothetical protein BJF78_15885 [Pseudonocardia sp. CNS-139]|nr:hypothetical protein BJF78_15885 [Pseudonocardia sp. CNS-139]
MTSEEPPRAPADPGPPPQIRLAGALVGVQALAAVAFAVVLVVGSFGAEQMGDYLGQAAYFVVIGAGLAAVGGGLVLGRRWARTPAIVTQLLLLPVVYTLIGPSHQLVIGILTGLFVGGTFMLLISERSRVWSMGLDLPDRSDHSDHPESRR